MSSSTSLRPQVPFSRRMKFVAAAYALLTADALDCHFGLLAWGLPASLLQRDAFYLPPALAVFGHASLPFALFRSFSPLTYFL